MKNSLFLFIGWVVFVAVITLWWLRVGNFAIYNIVVFFVTLALGEIAIVFADWHLTWKGVFKR